MGNMLRKCNRFPAFSAFRPSRRPSLVIIRRFSLGSIWLSAGITPASHFAHPPGSPPGPLPHIRDVESFPRGTVESPSIVPFRARGRIARGIDAGIPLRREVPNILIPYHPAFRAVPLPKGLP